MRGDSNTPLYWNRPDKTAETMREEGWIYTGDRFVRDADGFHFFRGRADDLIKISGQWVYPLEVELCLAEHPDVRECAVFAVELPDRRMTLKAVVVMNEGGFDAAATKMLQDYVKATLLPYKYPREIKFLDELPKTGTGKIDRQALMKVQRLRSNTLRVVPASGRTHNRRCLLCYRMRPQPSPNTHWCVWVPAQGRDDGGFSLPVPFRHRARRDRRNNLPTSSRS